MTSHLHVFCSLIESKYDWVWGQLEHRITVFAFKCIVQIDGKFLETIWNIFY